MTGAVIVIVVIAVGLPLLAWWVGGRAFWGRLPRRSEPDLYRRIVLDNHLRPAEIAQVESAVTWGRRVEDERLRAAVVDWAQSLRAAAAERRAAHPGRRRAVLAILGVWAVSILAVAVVQFSGGNWTALLRAAGYGLVLGLPGVLAARGPRRAIELNSPIREDITREGR